MKQGILSTSMCFRVGKKRGLGRKSAATATNNVTMLSTVTNAPFARMCQPLLRNVAKEWKYSSRYWVTQPQATRSCNARILPGEKPSTIYLNVEAVVALKSLSKNDQRRILEEYPPFFGSGVGIFSERKKWLAVTAERMIRLLNPNEKERALFIDVEMAKELGLKFQQKDIQDVRPASSVHVYNAEQLDDPYKGEPEKGIALNAATGKRIGQPAHDILLAVGILRGYTSPMWVAEKQMKYLNLELKRKAQIEAVEAPNMEGVIVSLSHVPPNCQKELLKELKSSHPHAFGHDVYFLYNVNGWEVTRSRVLVKNMAAICDQTFPFHFVNLSDLAMQKPEYSKKIMSMVARKKPIGVALLPKIDGEKEGAKSVESGLAVQSVQGVPFFCAEDATLRRYFNAACMTQPHLTVPLMRPVAVSNGKLIGRRDEAILRAFALKQKLSSPIWVTESSANRMGVRILDKYKKSFVAIGASALDENTECSIESFYNIDDFVNPEEILSLFPKASRNVHFMLDSKWRPVLGKQRQDYLSSLKRSRPLWVSVNECLMSGFEPQKDAALVSFPQKQGQKQDVAGVKLYNSQFTSDPVRIIGLSTVYTRPQGLAL